MIPITQKAFETDGVKTIWLIGMPGSGKSTLATYFDGSDTDELFTGGSHMSATHKDPGAFYDEEERVVIDYTMTNPTGIIATGGSVVHRDGACRAMATVPHSRIVYLYTPLDIIKRRLGDFDARGIVFPPNVGSLDELYQFREPLYRRHCDYILDTSMQTLEECTNQMSSLLS